MRVVISRSHCLGATRLAPTRVTTGRLSLRGARKRKEKRMKVGSKSDGNIGTVNINDSYWCESQVG